MSDICTGLALEAPCGHNSKVNQVHEDPHIRRSHNTDYLDAHHTNTHHTISHHTDNWSRGPTPVRRPTHSHKHCHVHERDQHRTRLVPVWKTKIIHENKTVFRHHDRVVRRMVMKKNLIWRKRGFGHRME